MSQRCISYAGMSKQIKGLDLPESQSFGFFVWLHISGSEAATSIACQTYLNNQWMKTVTVSEM